MWTHLRRYTLLQRFSETYLDFSSRISSAYIYVYHSFERFIVPDTTHATVGTPRKLSRARGSSVKLHEILPLIHVTVTKREKRLSAARPCPATTTALLFISFLPSRCCDISFLSGRCYCANRNAHGRVKNGRVHYRPPIIPRLVNV